METVMSNLYRINETVNELQELAAKPEYDGNKTGLDEISSLLDTLRQSVRYVAPDFNGYVDTYLDEGLVERVRQLVNRDLDPDNVFELPASEVVTDFLKPRDGVSSAQRARFAATVAEAAFYEAEHSYVNDPENKTSNQELEELRFHKEAAANIAATLETGNVEAVYEMGYQNVEEAAAFAESEAFQCWQGAIGFYTEKRDYVRTS